MQWTHEAGAPVVSSTGGFNIAVFDIWSNGKLLKGPSGEAGGEAGTAAANAS